MVKLYIDNDTNPQPLYTSAHLVVMPRLRELVLDMFEPDEVLAAFTFPALDWLALRGCFRLSSLDVVSTNCPALSELALGTATFVGAHLRVCSATVLELAHEAVTEQLLSMFPDVDTLTVDRPDNSALTTIAAWAESAPHDLQVLHVDEFLDDNINDETLSRLHSALPDTQIERPQTCREVARLGSAEEKYELGQRLEEGDRIDKDEKEAAEWYLQAANEGHAEAQLELGQMCERANDPRIREEWFLMAANEGHATGQYGLAKRLLARKDYNGALEWLRKVSTKPRIRDEARGLLADVEVLH